MTEPARQQLGPMSVSRWGNPRARYVAVCAPTDAEQAEVLLEHGAAVFALDGGGGADDVSELARLAAVIYAGLPIVLVGTGAAAEAVASCAERRLGDVAAVVIDPSSADALAAHLDRVVPAPGPLPADSDDGTAERYGGGWGVTVERPD